MPIGVYKRKPRSLRHCRNLAIDKKRYFSMPEAREKDRLAQLLYNERHPEKGQKHSRLMTQKWAIDKVFKIKLLNHLEELNSKQVADGSPSWLGGKSFEPYTPEFNKVLKEEIRTRDKHTCQLCGWQQNGRRLDVHHIDYNKEDVSPQNLITLCHLCNTKVNANRTYWQVYFKQLLAERLGICR